MGFKKEEWIIAKKAQNEHFLVLCNTGSMSYGRKKMFRE